MGTSLLQNGALWDMRIVIFVQQVYDMMSSVGIQDLNIRFIDDSVRKFKFINFVLFTFIIPRSDCCEMWHICALSEMKEWWSDKNIYNGKLLFLYRFELRLKIFKCNGLQFIYFSWRVITSHPVCGKTNWREKRRCVKCWLSTRQMFANGSLRSKYSKDILPSATRTNWWESILQIRKISAISSETEGPGAPFMTRTLQLRFREFSAPIIYMIPFP